jgi:protocatechuate 3,4-dioxygenase beta subunit
MVSFDVNGADTVYLGTSWEAGVRWVRCVPEGFPSTAALRTFATSALPIGPTEEHTITMDRIAHTHGDHHTDGHADGHIDGGLAHDLPGLLGRRRLLGLVAAAAGAAVLAACGSDSDASSSTASSASSGTTGATTDTADTTAATTADTTGASTASSVDTSELTVVPEETAGPYPGDGSNGKNVLTQSGVVRSDITSSIGDASGTADGLPATISLTILDSTNQYQPYSGAVYLWHANRDGEYSMYSSSIADQNYLRGVQETDANGTATFTSIFPGCYDGRWPHIHFEVYPGLDDALAASNITTTSQIALQQAACEVAYTADGYSQSITNLSRTSLATDNVFGEDGGVHQLATMTGDATNGYTIALTIAV